MNFTYFILKHNLYLIIFRVPAAPNAAEFIETAWKMFFTQKSSSPAARNKKKTNIFIFAWKGFWLLAVDPSSAKGIESCPWMCSEFHYGISRASLCYRSYEKAIEHRIFDVTQSHYSWDGFGIILFNEQGFITSIINLIFFLWYRCHIMLLLPRKIWLSSLANYITIYHYILKACRY